MVLHYLNSTHLLFTSTSQNNQIFSLIFLETHIRASKVETLKWKNGVIVVSLMPFD